MNRLNYIFLLLFLASYSFSQEEFSSWKLEKEINIGEHSQWTTDGLGNHIISRQEHLQKLDENGNLLFDQSVKSFGEIKTIDRLNTLKFLSFSEEQQTICFFDNSLSILEDCIELSDFNIAFATHVSSSSQSNKIWVYDEVNSTLHLLILNKLLQSQEIKNLNALLGMSSLICFKERKNRLYCASKEEVFVLDVFGTLIQRIPIKNVIDIEVKGDNVLLLTKDKLVLYNSISLQQNSMDLPIQNVLQIKLEDGGIYFHTKKKLSKYRIVFKK